VCGEVTNSRIGAYFTRWVRKSAPFVCDYSFEGNLLRGDSVGLIVDQQNVDVAAVYVFAHFHPFAGLDTETVCDSVDGQARSDVRAGNVIEGPEDLSALVVNGDKLSELVGISRAAEEAVTRYRREAHFDGSRISSTASF
jgi:hypothetical protein